MDAIYSLFTWQFAAGFLVGLAIQQAFSALRARWLDRQYPLPGGRHRRGLGVNRVWAAGAVAVFILGLVMVQTQQTADYQRRLASEVQSCQREFFEALRARSAITTENDRLSREERTAFADWLRELLNPPPDIAALDQDDLRYQQWGLGVTEFYYSKIKGAEDQQRENERERSASPLPEPTCGR